MSEEIYQPAIRLPIDSCSDYPSLMSILDELEFYKHTFFTMQRFEGGSGFERPDGPLYARSAEEAAKKITESWESGFDVEIRDVTESVDLHLEDEVPRTAALSIVDWEGDVMPRTIVERLIYEGSVHLMTGASKVGKSMLAIQLLMCIADDMDFLGLRVSKIKTLLISLEMTAAMQRERMKGIERDTGIKVPEIGKDFDAIAPTVSNIVTLDLGTAAGLAELKEWIIKYQAKLVILDTLYRFAPGLDPNSNSAMGKLFGDLNAVAQDTGAALLILDHVAKGDFSGPTSHSGLGASIKGGASRGTIHLKRTTKEGGGRWELTTESHFDTWTEPIHYERPQRQDGSYGDGAVLCVATRAHDITFQELELIFTENGVEDDEGQMCFKSKNALIEALIEHEKCHRKADGLKIVRAIDKDYCVPDTAKGWGENRPIITSEGPRNATIYTLRSVDDCTSDIPF